MLSNDIIFKLKLPSKNGLSLSVVQPRDSKSDIFSVTNCRKQGKPLRLLSWARVLLNHT